MRGPRLAELDRPTGQVVRYAQLYARNQACLAARAGWLHYYNCHRNNVPGNHT